MALDANAEKDAGSQLLTNISAVQEAVLAMVSSGESEEPYNQIDYVFVGKLFNNGLAIRIAHSAWKSSGSKSALLSLKAHVFSYGFLTNKPAPLVTSESFGGFGGIAKQAKAANLLKARGGVGTDLVAKSSSPSCSHMSGVAESTSLRVQDRLMVLDGRKVSQVAVVAGLSVKASSSASLARACISAAWAQCCTWRG